MKILVVDDEADYLLMFEYLFEHDIEEVDVSYLNDFSTISSVDFESFEAILCDFRLQGYGNAADIYKYAHLHGFSGRFIILTHAAKPVVIEELIRREIFGVEIVEKGRSYVLRQLLHELKDNG